MTLPVAPGLTRSAHRVVTAGHHGDRWRSPRSGDPTVMQGRYTPCVRTRNVSPPSSSTARRRRWRRIGTRGAVVVAAVALALTHVAPASAMTVEYLDGTTIRIGSKRWEYRRMRASMWVELRMDGTYWWWVNVKNDTTYGQGFHLTCTVFVTEHRIPVQVKTDWISVPRRTTRVVEGHKPTLSEPWPHSQTLEDEWGAMWNGDWTATCYSFDDIKDS